MTLTLPQDISKIHKGMRVKVNGDLHQFTIFQIDEIDIKGKKLISHGKIKDFLWAYFHESSPLVLEVL
jgi:hypothetical protein